MDRIFEDLEYDEFQNSWLGRLRLDFFGTETEVLLIVQTEDEARDIQESQRRALQSFLTRWPELQRRVAQRILRYYHEEERLRCGPDGESERRQWWPELPTVEALLKKITWEAVVIHSDDLMQQVYGGKRCLCLLFGRQWGEDPDDNGIGIRLINEEIDEIGLQDLAF